MPNPFPPKKKATKTMVAKPPVPVYKDVDGEIKTKGGGDAKYPRKHSPYKMYPGMHSEVNPGNFKGSEVKKYSAFKVHPMKFEDQKGTGPGITKADKIAVAQNGYDPKMYPKAHHPMNFKNQLGRAVGLAKKADKAYRSEGDKNDPDYQNMMNPKIYKK